MDQQALPSLQQETDCAGARPQVRPLSIRAAQETLLEALMQQGVGNGLTTLSASSTSPRAC